MGTRDAGLQRIDRWLTLSVVAPLAHAWRAPASEAVPILMYHSVANDVDDRVHPYFRTVTTPATFSRQLEWLGSAGYRPVTLSAALQALAEHTAATLERAPRPVALTFDDGLSDYLRFAHPVIEQCGGGATVFVSTGYIGKPFPTGRPCLDAAELRELADAGVEIGSHSVTHRKLVELSRAELIEELVASKRTLEDITGRAVTLFSYPYRFPQENRPFTALLADLLESAGYRACVTTTLGRARPGQSPWLLPRLPVNDCDDVALLEAKLDGHYDWVAMGQSMRKRSRALARRWSGR